MGQKENDGYTRQGAAALARTIEQHWHARGFIGVGVVIYPVAEFSNTWGVRSNLVNGLPQTRRK